MIENVVALRQQPQLSSNALESQLLGAILDLPDPLTMFDMAGLGNGGELSDKRIGLFWAAGMKLAQRNRIVDPDTVFSVVRNANMCANEDRLWLRELRADNLLTKESFAEVAENLRRSLLARSIAPTVEAVARALRSGDFDSARIAADLETVGHSLLKVEGNIETAASDVVDLDATWAQHELVGSSPLQPTGIRLLDETIKGSPPNLMVVAGQPGVGKNMLLASWIRAALESDPDSCQGLFALEDGSKWLIKRWTAQDLGMPLNMIGHGKRTPEQIDKLTELNPHYHRLLERLLIYRFDEIRPDDLVHRARGWIHRKGVKRIWIDHLGHLDHTPARIPGRRDFFGEKRNESVQIAVRKFASLAYREEISMIALAHTVRPESQKDEERPPRLSEIAESAGIERRIRCALGLWRTKSRELRCTVLKNTEGPGVDTTIEFEQNKESATIEPSGGRYVNLDQERKELRAEKEDDSEARADERRKKKAAKRAAEKAEIEKATADREAVAVKISAPQLSLIEAPE